tara:strand:+ start:127 stop:318 length:192 start_codon:yes stop_codon:yes gene_type:complete
MLNGVTLDNISIIQVNIIVKLEKLVKSMSSDTKIFEGNVLKVSKMAVKKLSSNFIFSNVKIKE